MKFGIAVFLTFSFSLKFKVHICDLWVVRYDVVLELRLRPK